jgi:hypothetical protein
MNIHVLRATTKFAVSLQRIRGRSFAEASGTTAVDEAAETIRHDNTAAGSSAVCLTTGPEVRCLNVFTV